MVPASDKQPDVRAHSSRDIDAVLQAFEGAGRALTLIT